MKTKFKESKEFRSIALEITFESIEEMVFFANNLLDDNDIILGIGNDVLDYIKKHYNDTNQG